MMWVYDELVKVLAQPVSEFKYVITDDKEEFLSRMETIANNGLKQTHDNLRYLELLEKVKEVRDGADIYEVYPFLKRDK